MINVSIKNIKADSVVTTCGKKLPIENYIGPDLKEGTRDNAIACLFEYDGVLLSYTYSTGDTCVVSLTYEDYTIVSIDLECRIAVDSLGNALQITHALNSLGDECELNDDDARAFVAGPTFDGRWWAINPNDLPLLN